LGSVEKGESVAFSDSQPTEDTVLLADDSARFLSSCSRVLRQGVGRVLIAETCEQTIETVDEKPPNLVLLDIDFKDPEFTGIDCLAVMRARGYEGVVCMLTGLFSYEKLLSALLAGADDYLVKGDYDLVAEARRLIEFGKKLPGYRLVFDAVAEGGLLRSMGYRDQQSGLLKRDPRFGSGWIGSASGWVSRTRDS
jgi:ActR/RegA family two-component response regulator